MKVLIAEHTAVTRFPFPDDGGLVLAASLHMPVEAVVADVEFAADEPLGVRLVPDQHLVPAPEPVKLFSLLGPETVRVIFGPLPQPFILSHALYMGPRRKVLRRGKDP